MEPPDPTLRVDEIYQLNAENERLRIALVKQTEQHEYPCSPHCAGFLREQQAQAEIERLRARWERGKAEMEKADRALRAVTKENERLRAVIVRAKDALLDGQSTQWVHDLLVAVLLESISDRDPMLKLMAAEKENERLLEENSSLVSQRVENEAENERLREAVQTLRDLRKLDGKEIERLQAKVRRLQASK